MKNSLKLAGSLPFRFIKRTFDIFFSLILMIPVLLIIGISAIFIKAEDGGPVFYMAERLGCFGKPFKMFKLRSMKVNAPDIRLADGSTYNGDDDPRVTKFGKIARKTSIDELPQIINILKGDMSFIGPRPTLTYHPWKLEEYTDFQRRRFEVRPGITGLAQVHGRKAIDWNDRIKYDVEYVDNLSLGLDCKILFRTVWNVLTMKDNDNVGETSQTKENKDA